MNAGIQSSPTSKARGKHPDRRSFLGLDAVGGAVVVAGSFELSTPFSVNPKYVLNTPSQGWRHADMMIVVTSDGKLFHASGCPFIHDKTHIRTIVGQRGTE